MTKSERPWYLSPHYIAIKVRENGLAYCAKCFLRIIYRHGHSFLKHLFDTLRNIKLYISNLQNTIHCIILPSKHYVDSVLAIYDFSASPYTYNFVEFLANCEVFRVQNSLSNIDMVFVVDKEKRHRGDQPEVTESNYRNWILNLAENTDLLKSISSLSIFDSKHKFLSFYQNTRHTHKVFPDNGLVYIPKSAYHLKGVSDYFRSTGYVPKFESSGVLLDWAEKYFIEKSYPLFPVVIFVRNSKTHSGRNTNWSVWLDFFRAVVDKYPVKFFIVNDFWNPVDVPSELETKVTISAEATISTKYRCALTQRATLVMGPAIGSAACVLFTDTPYLTFGFDNEYFDAAFNIREHGMTEDLQFPWHSNYQRIFPVQAGDAEYIKARFEEMYALLGKDHRLEPNYFKLSRRE